MHEEEHPPLSLAAGREIIKSYVNQLPLSAGVYRMLDGDGKALYVGKAKHLKNRVSNYVNVAALNTRLQRMVSLTASMEIITTRSEAEALLLEANLIKKYMPRYNILLRDDKSFPYIFLSGDHAFARIGKHRGAKVAKGRYFGPFVSVSAVNETILFLQKAFLLRPCSDNIFKNRTRPCLQYQIKRCSAPCVGKISEADYAELVAQAEAFLSGKSQEVQQGLMAEMQQLSQDMQFEKAAILRDRIKALNQIQQGQALQAKGIGDADVIALARDSGMACVQLFSFRSGRNYGTKSYFPQHTLGSSDSEILSTFIGQFYQTQPIPSLILVSHALDEVTLLQEALQLQSGKSVEIALPLRGDKRDVIDEAMRNAREALMRYLAIHISQREIMKQCRDLFGLDEVPERIEIYDNSHISGAHAVGAMVVAGREGFIKNAYRTFNIKREDIVAGDDYGMMREVLTRRFKRMQEEQEETNINSSSSDDVTLALRRGNAALGNASDTDSNTNRYSKPDLVLVDGGAGQLSIALQVFEELGIQGITLAGISKGPDRNAGREWFHMDGREPFQLPVNDPLLHYVQRLRDEAHRFAIGTHRNKRSKAIHSSPLDAIDGIGPTRKKALLSHFGSVKDLSGASMDDIAKVAGISPAMAKMIYEHFHS